MRNRIVVACFIVAGIVGLGTHTSTAAFANGNSDAAHACQHGGYAALFQSDGVTSFANAGACVSYVAHGGKLSDGLPACTFTPGATGCETFVSAQATTDPLMSPISTLSLSGAVSFDLFGPAASGGGTYTVQTGGVTTESGTWTATGVLFNSYFSPTVSSDTCSDAISQPGGGANVYLFATFTPTGGTASNSALLFTHYLNAGSGSGIVVSGANYAFIQSIGAGTNTVTC